MVEVRDLQEMTGWFSESAAQAGCSLPGKRIKLKCLPSIESNIFQEKTKSVNVRWVQSSMLSDLPGQPREGASVPGTDGSVRAYRSSAWSRVGPKTDLRGLEEEGTTDTDQRAVAVRPGREAA